MKLFIINTNKQRDMRYEQEMLSEKKCAAYRTTKQEIEAIQMGDKVLLYSNEVGIIASGIADGVLQKNEDNGEIDAEYYMSLNEFYQFIKPISYNKIRKILQKADPSFNKLFNVTVLKIDSPVSEEVWHEVCMYV